MNTRIIVTIAISFVFAISGTQSAQAQLEGISGTQPLPLAESVHPLKWMNQEGTDELQEKVLTQINAGLLNGWLSVADASQLKSRLNKLSNEETWYKSLNSQISPELIERNRMLLNEMIHRLQPKPVLTAYTDNALHADLDTLIGKALAANHITSGEAESYYLRLAQIESNLENNKRIPAGLSVETASMDKSLHELKSELIRKVN